MEFIPHFGCVSELISKIESLSFGFIGHLSWPWIIDLDELLDLMNGIDVKLTVIFLKFIHPHSYLCKSHLLIDCLFFFSSFFLQVSVHQRNLLHNGFSQPELCKKKSSSIQLVGYRFISTESIGKMGVAVGINENWQRWNVAKNNRQSVLLYL